MVKYERMNIRKRLVRWAKDAWALPLIYRVPALVFITLFLLYGVIFLPPKEVVFSYASKDTCVNHLTIFPGVLRQMGDTHFTLKAANVVSVAGVPLVATKTCVGATRAPAEGAYREAVSLGGTAFFKKGFIIRLGKPPVVVLADLGGQVPTSRPLTIRLSSTDKVFTYRIIVGGRPVTCMSGNAKIVCDITVLNLRQGVAYTLQLERLFKNVPEVIASQKITTLAATRVVKTSIKLGSTIYSKPRSFTFVFDKPLEKVTPQLYLISGKNRQLIKTTYLRDGKTLKVSIAADLARSKTFSLTLASLQATDGSSLAASYALTFKTSGGPRVIGVNMGSTGIPQGATIVVSFDQTLSAHQDISRLVNTSGGVVYAGKSGNQLYVRLASVPRCGNFDISLNSAIQSNYEIGGSSAWSFRGRTMCHTTQTIGYSVNGRPITAYTFGSGPAVLYTGAIHGNEVSTSSLMYQWVDELEANAGSIPAGRSVVVVPTINPDGVAAGTRTNAHNVDLNRNFSTSDWRSNITDVNNRPFPGGGGKSPMSEPEVRVIASFVSRLRPLRVLSYHSIGGVVAANQAGTSGAYASTYSRLSGYGNVTGQSGETFDYSISGTADDYYAQKLGVASILVELGSHSYSQFGLNQAAMWAMLR
jgi:predicted deacylase